MRAIKIPELECKQCGHKLRPSVERPKACPRCKSYRWNELRVDKASGDEVAAATEQAAAAVTEPEAQ
jgi:Zn finger protein HypA/HybF involved in hydrogenase expression